MEEPGSKLSTTSKSPLSTLKRRSFGPNKPHLLPSTLLTNANGGYSRKQRRLADIDIYIQPRWRGAAGTGSVQDVRAGNSVCAAYVARRDGVISKTCCWAWTHPDGLKPDPPTGGKGPM